MEKESPTLDFYLYKTKRSPFWYVKFRDPETRVIRHGVSSRIKNVNRARDWARVQYSEMVERAAHPDMSLRDFAAGFWSEDCSYVRRKMNDDGHYAEKTRRDNRTRLERYILPDEDLAALELRDLDRDAILAFRDRLIEEHFGGESCRTVQLVMSNLRTIVNAAREKGLITTEPFFRVKLGAYAEHERKALSEEELDAVLARSRYSDRFFWEATIVTAATGMRAGEVRALRWGDLRPKAAPVPLVFVERAAKNESGDVGLPKWEKKRTCPYPAAARTVLEPRRGEASEYVFGDHQKGHGGMLGYTRWAKAFRAAAAGAGVEASLHSLRHTLNTILIQRGIPEGVIRAALGWSDPKIQARYTHIDTFGATYRSALVDSVVEAITGRDSIAKAKSGQAG